MPTKQYTFVNGAGRTVPASVVASNKDGTYDIHAAEGDGDQVVLVQGVSLGEGGGYLQETGK